MPLPSLEQMRAWFPEYSQELWDRLASMTVSFPDGVSLVSYLEPATDCELTADAE